MTFADVCESHWVCPMRLHTDYRFMTLIEFGRL